MASKREIRIPGSVADLVASCNDEGVASRVLYIMFLYIKDGAIPDMTNEEPAVRALLSVASMMMRNAEHRREQNRAAWERYKTNACQATANACQALAKRAEETLPPTPPIREEERENTTTLKVKESNIPSPLPSPTSACQATDKQDRELIEAAFAKFWKLYPRKDGKKPANQAFVNLFRTTAKSKRNKLYRDIASALRKDCESDQWTRDGGRFIPHATTWIHQQRWEDEGVVKQEEKPDTTAADELATKLLKEMN